MDIEKNDFFTMIQHLIAKKSFYLIGYGKLNKKI